MTSEELEALQNEKERLLKAYYDLADAIAASSSSTEELVNVARSTRLERDRLLKAIKFAPIDPRWRPMRTAPRDGKMWLEIQICKLHEGDSLENLFTTKSIFRVLYENSEVPGARCYRPAHPDWQEE